MWKIVVCVLFCRLLQETRVAGNIPRHGKKYSETQKEILQDRKGNILLKQRLNVLENRYDVDRVQYRNDVMDLQSRIDEVEHSCKSPNTELVAAEGIQNENLKPDNTRINDVDAVEDALEQTKQSLKTFQSGLSAEKKYIREQFELFTTDIKAKTKQLRTNLQETNDKLTDELQSSIAELNNTLENETFELKINAVEKRFEKQLEDIGQEGITERARSMEMEKKFEEQLKELRQDSITDAVHAMEEKFKEQLAEFRQSISCSNGWMRHGSHCYYFSQDQQSWWSASSRCKTLGGYLAEPTTHTDFMFLYAIFRQMDFWMGGSDSTTEGRWLWVVQRSEISRSNSNWGRGQPDGRSGEDCLQWIAKYQAWTDRGCAYQFHYVCQQ